jgi:CDP-diacylglycerol--serine O-phosphatidyltransferase
VLFDFLDGRVARMTNSTTQFGVEFDSIADVLTFGIAPAVLAYCWGYGYVNPYGRLAFGISFMYLICGALRLARFNVQASKPALQKPGASPKVEKKAFVGLPIPAGASLIAALAHFSPAPIARTRTTLDLFGTSVPVRSQELAMALLLLVAGISLLMVSTIRHTSFKTIGPRQRNPMRLIVLIAMGVTAVWLWSQETLLIMATIYVLHGLIGKILGIFRHHPHGQTQPEAAAD